MNFNLEKFRINDHRDFYDFLFAIKKCPATAMNLWFKNVKKELPETSFERYKYTELSKTYRHFIRLHYGLKKYEKIYNIDNQLWSILSKISPDNLQMTDIKLPMPITILYFQQPVYILKHQVSIVVINDSDILNNDEFNKIALDCFGKLIKDRELEINFMSGYRTISCFGIEYIYPAVAWTDLKTDMLVGDSLQLSYDKADDIPEEDNRACMNFFRNLLSFLASTMAYQDVVWNAFPKSINKKYCEKVDKRDNIDILSATWIGKKPDKAMSESNGLGNKLRPHWRSAHWKMQPYGLKNSLRKMIWIEAYVTGKKIYEKD